MKSKFNGWRVIENLTGGLGQWLAIIGTVYFTIGSFSDSRDFAYVIICALCYPLFFFLNIFAHLCAAGRDIEINESNKKENL